MFVRYMMALSGVKFPEEAAGTPGAVPPIQ